MDRLTFESFERSGNKLQTTQMGQLTVEKIKMLYNSNIAQTVENSELGGNLENLVSNFASYLNERSQSWLQTVYVMTGLGC